MPPASRRWPTRRLTKESMRAVDAFERILSISGLRA
jgi:hypothetical protein